MTSADGLPTITTFSGRTFDFSKPDPESVCIEDIAHGLALECRFANQCRVHYSVAQHSILVEQYVRPRNQGLELPRIALMHDSAEAYMGDMNRPLKRLIPQYREIEARVHEAICKRFGIPSVIPQAVKDADNQVLANEGVAVMRKDWRDASAEPCEEIGLIQPWSAEEAELRFLERFRLLFYGGTP